MPGSAPAAFVTLVTSDSYAPGALALAHALRARADPQAHFDLVVLATPATLAPSTQHALRAAFDLVVGVEPLSLRSLASLAVQSDRTYLTQQEALNLAALDRPDLGDKGAPLTKVHAWRLTSYQQVVYIDADVLPLRPLDHLLTIPLAKGTVAAAPDAGWPDTFNSGLLVLQPCDATFAAIAAYAATHPSWDGADQGLLNDFVASEGHWQRLSFLYNVTPSNGYIYSPAWARFSHEAYAVHFIGSHKPWFDLAPIRAAEGCASSIPSAPAAGDFSSLAYTWWQTYVAARPDPDPLALGHAASCTSRSWANDSQGHDAAAENYVLLPVPGKKDILPAHLTHLVIAPQPQPEPVAVATKPASPLHTAHTTLPAAPADPLPTAGITLPAAPASPLHTARTTLPAPPPSSTLGTQTPQAPPDLARQTFQNAWDDLGRDRAQAQEQARQRAELEAQHRARQTTVLEHLARTQGDTWAAYLPPKKPSEAKPEAKLEAKPVEHVNKDSNAPPPGHREGYGPNTPRATRFFPEDEIVTQPGHTHQPAPESKPARASSRPDHSVTAAQPARPVGMSGEIKYSNAWDAIPSIAALGGQRKVLGRTSSGRSSLRAAIRARVAEANRSDAEERALAHAQATGPPTRGTMSSAASNTSSVPSLPERDRSSPTKDQL